MTTKAKTTLSIIKLGQRLLLTNQTRESYKLLLSAQQHIYLCCKQLQTTHFTYTYVATTLYLPSKHIIRAVCNTNRKHDAHKAQLHPLLAPYTHSNFSEITICGPKKFKHIFLSITKNTKPITTTYISHRIPHSLLPHQLTISTQIQPVVILSSQKAKKHFAAREYKPINHLDRSTTQNATTPQSRPFTTTFSQKTQNAKCGPTKFRKLFQHEKHKHATSTHIHYLTQHSHKINLKNAKCGP